MSRWRASGLHFLISLTILAGALALMRLLWYPDFFFAAVGAGGLAALLFSVDVTLGPLITLIIFKSGKKGLKFDLAFIAVCQFAALLYGMYTVFIARPVFAVFSVDRFEVVQAVEVDLSGAQDAEFPAVPLTGPRWAAMKVPQDAPVQTVIEAVMGGKNLSQYARFLVSYDRAKDLAVTRAKPLKGLHRKGAEANERVEQFLSAHGVGEDEVVYMPLMARAENMVVIIARTSGDILGVVRVTP